MSITFEDARDVVRYFAEHPELVRELRPLVLSEELLRLPEQMREWQAQSNERFERLEAAIAENSRQIDRLIAAQERFEARMEHFELRLEGVEGRLGNVEDRLGKVEGRLGNVEGKLLELGYGGQADAWFGRWLRRPKRADWGEVADRLDAAVDSEEVTEAETEDVRRLDLLVSGRLKQTGEDVLLAVEVSTTIHVDDITRATRRAAILRKVGFRAIPFVGGESISDEAKLQWNVTPDLIVDLR